jgi:Protein of unknown function (DUF2793)
MAGNPDDKKISQLPENPVVLDADEFSSITPRTDGSIGYENVKTPGWKLKQYTNTDPVIAGQARFDDGKRNAPSIAHYLDTDTGIWFPVDDTLCVGTAGVETITIDPANNAIIGPEGPVLNDSRDGFLYLPTMAGAPTALPRQYADKSPIVVDTVNNVVFVYSGGAWRPLVPSNAPSSPGVVVPPPVTRLDALDDVLAKGASLPKNGDALVWDAASNKWKPARSGMEVTIRPNRLQAYPNPASLPAGHLILTIENGVKEIAVVSAAKRIEILYSDSELLTKIASSSLFQGVRPDKTELAKLPAPAPTNKGFYWTWTGPASTPIVPADFTNGGGFTATLQVGDWLQSDGTKYVHVPSDLMSKLRWISVGSFRTWTDTNFEVDTLVVHNGRFYRSTAAITTGDPAPDAGGSWVDITPNYNLSGLLDVDLTTPTVTGDALVFDGVRWTARPPIPLGNNDGEIISWDSTLGEWVTGANYMGAESNVTFATVSNVGVPVYDEPNNTFEVRRLNLEELADCADLSTAGDGEVPAWDAANNKWVPQAVSLSQKFLGSLASRPAAVNVGDTYYQTTAQTITTTTPGTTPAGIVAPTPLYDPLMNTPLQAGAVPDPASPGNPWRNPAVVPLPSTEPKYRFIYNGVTYQVDGAAPLIARINAGQATPDLWAQGANPPISVSTGTPGATTTTNVGVGFYRWDGANWVRVASNLGDLPDVDLTTVAQANGDALVWDATASKWKPKKITSPIIYLGTGAWVAADVNDAAKRYGMAADTVPSPADYAPIAGDQYIDLATGQITTFTGAAPTAGTIRTVSGITGGNSPPTFDMAKDLLIDLRDVDLKTTAPVASDVLTYNGSKWIALAPAGYSQAEIDTKLDSLVIGLSHETAVIAITNDPPAAPVDDEFYIVGVAPTGDFVGHATHIAYHVGGVWRFQTPVKGETRLVESAGIDGENWHFNGTIWVKVANASVAAPKVASMSMVGDIKQSWLSETEFNGILVAAGENGKWVLADGRDVTGSDFAKVTGLSNVPDLRGSYFRAAGQNNNHLTAWDGGTHRGYMNHATARPTTAFTGTTNDPGNHDHGIQGDWHVIVTEKGGHDLHPGGGGNPEGNAPITPQGAHTHTVTINGGGDAETRPSTYSVNTYIKVNN